MPCSDSGVPYPPTELEQLDAKTPAMLCALLGALTQAESLDRVFSLVDWREAGVTQKQVRRWWSLHQLRDAERRATYKRENAQQAAARRARAKLTPADAEALGLPPLNKEVK